MRFLTVVFIAAGCGQSSPEAHAPKPTPAKLGPTPAEAPVVVELGLRDDDEHIEPMTLGPGPGCPKAQPGSMQPSCAPRVANPRIQAEMSVMTQRLPTAYPACTQPVPESIACTVGSTQNLRQQVDACRERANDPKLARMERGGVVLTTAGAKLVASSARSKNMLDVSLDTNPRVAKLAVAAVFMTLIEKAPPQQLGELAAACLSAIDQIDGGQPVTGLTCATRIASGVSAAPLLGRWPGCSCGERGTLVGDVCFVSTSWDRDFADVPIDARIPPMLQNAVASVNRDLVNAGLTKQQIRGVALIGCHYPRLERGAAAQTLDQHSEPLLTAALVSDHTAGTACDIEQLWLADGTTTSVLAMYNALLDPTLESPRSEQELYRAYLARVASAGGEGPFYRALAAHPDLSTPLLAQLAIWATLRNVLVDAGFIVFTPATNASHKTHMHISARSLVDQTALASQTTAEARERWLSQKLDRAAGRRPRF